MTKKIYLKSPMKLIRSILVLLGIVVITMLVAISPSFSKDTPKYKTIVVEEGDTLWSISGVYSNSSEDIRDYIDEVKEMNQLKSSSLKEGQQLKVRIS